MKRNGPRGPGRRSTPPDPGRPSQEPARPAAVRLYGIHPVAERLATRPESVERIYATRGKRPGLGRLLKNARLCGVPVTYLSRELLASKVGARAVHQGVAAEVAPIEYADIEKLTELAAADPMAMLVWLDRVEDPRNVGAVLRSAAGAGAVGAILSAEGTAGLTAGAAKASAGAVERIPVARAADPARRIEGLKELGFRVIGLDPRADTPWDRADLDGRLLILAGGEHRGLRPGLARTCDQRVAIPLAAGVESLNVAVSIGVLLFEALRRRRQS